MVKKLKPLTSLQQQLCEDNVKLAKNMAIKARNKLRLNHDNFEELHAQLNLTLVNCAKAFDKDYKTAFFSYFYTAAMRQTNRFIENIKKNKNFIDPEINVKRCSKYLSPQMLDGKFSRETEELLDKCLTKKEKLFAKTHFSGYNLKETGLKCGNRTKKSVSKEMARLILKEILGKLRLYCEENNIDFKPIDTAVGLEPEINLN